MRYISTRGEAPELGFDDALLTGLARDGGLYVPKAWPQLAPEIIANFAGKPFADVAASILDLFAGGTIPRDELLVITREAYARFGHRPEQFPNASSDQAKILSLPMFAEITREQQNEVIELVRNF